MQWAFVRIVGARAHTTDLRLPLVTRAARGAGRIEARIGGELVVAGVLSLAIVAMNRRFRAGDPLSRAAVTLPWLGAGAAVAAMLSPERAPGWLPAARAGVLALSVGHLLGRLALARLSRSGGPATWRPKRKPAQAS